jgi:hypothetical protein
VRASSPFKRLTPGASGLLLVLAAAVTVLVVGPAHDEAPALIVIAVALAILVIGLLAGARGETPESEPARERRPRDGSEAGPGEEPDHNGPARPR